MDKQTRYMNNYIESAQAFNKTVDDIPKDVKPLAVVRNRPYSIFITISAVLLFFAIIIPSSRLVLGIIIAFILVAMMLISNPPILAVYDDFLVLYSYADGKNNPRVAIIYNDQLQSWDSKSTIGYNTVFYYKESEDEPVKLIGLNSINFQGCASVMNKYYHDKLDSIVKLTQYKEQLSKSKINPVQAFKNLTNMTKESKKISKERDAQEKLTNEKDKEND